MKSVHVQSYLSLSLPFKFKLLDEKMNSSMISNPCPHYIAQRVPGTNAILVIFTREQCTSFCTCADVSTILCVHTYSEIAYLSKSQFFVGIYAATPHSTHKPYVCTYMYGTYIYTYLCTYVIKMQKGKSLYFVICVELKCDLNMPYTYIPVHCVHMYVCTYMCTCTVCLYIQSVCKQCILFIEQCYIIHVCMYIHA